MKYEYTSRPIESYKLNGKLHRECGPAQIFYRRSGCVKNMMWYLNGEAHREDGPAYILYQSSGEISVTQWWLNGRLHRTDGPANAGFKISGKMDFEGWYLNGKLHRTDGPAHIIYNPSVDIIFHSFWYLYGKEIFPFQWLKENGYKWPLTKDQQTELLLMFG